MAAPRQKLMKDRATVVATTTFGVMLGPLIRVDMERGASYPFYDQSVGKPSAAALSRRVSEQLRTRGFRAYLVGGCVRDLLLGTVPKDYDISTDATPSQVLEIFPGANRVGAHFGVVLIREGDVHVEVATFRSETTYGDGRHPDRVEFETDPRADVERRDFTINALMMDPTTDEVLDYVGGRADIEARLIRAIGDPERRFLEDHLRMLRAVRFAARLGFEIEPATMAAIRRLHARITRVSAERVRDELVRILTEGSVRRGFELLDKSGLLNDILPEVAAMHGVEQPPEFHPEGDVWTHTLIMLGQLPAGTPCTLALGVLLHDAGKPGTFRLAPDRIRFDGHVELGVEITKRIMKRFRFSNAECEQVVALVANHMRFKDVARMKESTLKRFIALPNFNEHLELHRLDVSSSNGYMAAYDLVRRKIEETPPEQIRPPRLLTGRDLIQAGYQPGPKMGEILRALEDAQLEGVVSTPEQAWEWIRTTYPEAA
jgi:poly(A) polymerase